MSDQDRQAGKTPEGVDTGFTHLDAAGRPHMVDVGGKPDTEREAVAAGDVRMAKATLAAIAGGRVAKGDVLGVAQVAAIMAAKKTSDIVPMCHPLFLNAVAVDFALDEERGIVTIKATVRTTGKTGVEMEALTAVSAAALTIYDMCKAVDRGMVIEHIRLLEKSGGRSGLWQRDHDR
jgi:cyclic pyranopterin phosphate synthase